MSIDDAKEWIEMVNAKVTGTKFPYQFSMTYNKGGKAAGTYTRPSTSSTTWTKQP